MQKIIDEVNEEMEKKYNPEKQIFEIVKNRMNNQKNKKEVKKDANIKKRF